MVAFLTYDLKVAVLIAVFYMFYRLLLSRETFHRVNRVVLLTTAVASFVLPLCVITLHKTVVVSGGSGLVTLDGFGAMAEVAEPQAPLWQTLATLLFFAGMAVTLGHTILGTLKVWRLVSRSEKHPQEDGSVICVVDSEVSPFSWMRYIVLSRSDYGTNPALQRSEALPTTATILAHERGHICRHHSLDLLLVDTLTALQWFNPAMWMLCQDLRAIHEYEADAAVLSQGINMRQYQYLLIQKAVSHCGYSVVNGISHSTLKNRITMMLNKKSSSASLLKLLALVPVVGVALALNAETVNDYVYAEKTPQKQVVKKKGRKAAQVKMGDKTIEVKAEKVAATEENANATEAQVQKDAPKILFVESDGPEPLLVLNGKVATKEQVMALDQSEIDNTTVIKNEGALKEYAKHFNADTSNGIIFINTKEYVKNGKKEIVGVTVKTKEPAEDSEEGAFDVVEQMPEFPGGMAEMMKFLSMNVKYPVEAMKNGIEGRVLVQFIVEKDGNISSAKVVQKVNEQLDAEAVRVVNAMPKWKPGKQKGQPVRVKFTIPISFRLS